MCKSRRMFIYPPREKAVGLQYAAEGNAKVPRNRRRVRISWSAFTPLDYFRLFLMFIICYFVTALVGARVLTGSVFLYCPPPVEYLFAVYTETSLNKCNVCGQRDPLISNNRFRDYFALTDITRTVLEHSPLDIGLSLLSSISAFPGFLVSIVVHVVSWGRSFVNVCITLSRIPSPIFLPESIVGKFPFCLYKLCHFFLFVLFLSFLFLSGVANTAFIIISIDICVFTKYLCFFYYIILSGRLVHYELEIRNRDS